MLAGIVDFLEGDPDRPMITGRKRLPGATRQPRMVSPLLALMLVALAGCVVWVLATRV